MADEAEKKTLAELETEVDEEGDGKTLLRATSTIFGGRTESRATKKFLSSKKRVEFYVWARDLPYSPGTTIPIQGTCPPPRGLYLRALAAGDHRKIETNLCCYAVSIKNSSEKAVRSIMVRVGAPLVMWASH
jgi:hypothetical protein